MVDRRRQCFLFLGLIRYGRLRSPSSLFPPILFVFSPQLWRSVLGGVDKDTARVKDGVEGWGFLFNLLAHNISSK